MLLWSTFSEKNIRNKHIRFVYKQWIMCCTESGYCCNAEAYEGKINSSLERDVNGLRLPVISKKRADMDKSQDHFFRSFYLMKNLKEKQEWQDIVG